MSNTKRKSKSGKPGKAAKKKVAVKNLSKKGKSMKMGMAAVRRRLV